MGESGADHKIHLANLQFTSKPTPTRKADDEEEEDSDDEEEEGSDEEEEGSDEEEEDSTTK